MIIGVIGKKHHGKSEVGKYLGETKNYIRMAFADKVKYTVQDIYGLSIEQLWLSDKEVIDKRYNLTPRFIMQRFGTEVARQIHPDTWVLALAREVENIDKNIVIDDCRFKNEADWIHSEGGVIIRIVRPSIIEEDNHQSETEMTHIGQDYVISNTKDLSYIHNQVDFILGKIANG